MIRVEVDSEAQAATKISDEEYIYNEFLHWKQQQQKVKQKNKKRASKQEEQEHGV